jgi:hypothetical protein
MPMQAKKTPLNEKHAKKDRTKITRLSSLRLNGSIFGHHNRMLYKDKVLVGLVISQVLL